MNNLDIVNRLRLCSLDEFHKRLDFFEKNIPKSYEIVKEFLLTIPTDVKFQQPTGATNKL